MDHVAALRYSRLALTLVMTAALWGCGPGDDKGKDKKAEPAPPPKAAPKPPPPKPVTPPATPAPKPAAKAPTPESEGWVLLGQQQADLKTEKERIRIGTKEGRFKEIRIMVKGAPLTIDEVIVTFGNKKEFRPNIKQQLKDGESTQAIDLPGDARGIRNVQFVYRTPSRGEGKATVMLYAR